MKKVILESITLRNFRGEKERTTTFNPVETTIKGANGLGKSRHFDAFIWLLFGKDKQDRKDFEVKSVGAPAKTDCEVSATLDINGEKVQLRRVLTEKWVKPRGQVDEIYQGNETLLFWNDVPLKVGEFNARINELVNDKIFKMITNPMFFVNMDWKLQREQLFQLAGTITDSEIANKKPEYKALLEKITNKSLDDFKRELSARKRKLKDELEQIQPRIDQTQKLMPDNLDFTALEVEIASLDKQIADIDKAIADKSEAVRQQYEAEQKKQGRINELKQKQQQVLFSAQTKSREDAFAADEKRRIIENNIKVVESELTNLEQFIGANLNESQELATRITNKKKEVETLRKSWHDENAKEYEENDSCLVCPVFKINCADRIALASYAENKGKARESFVETKKNKLAEITEKGKQLSDEVQALNKEADKLFKKHNELTHKQSEQQNNLATLKTALSETSQADEKAVVADELPEYKTLGDLIKGIESTLSTDVQPIDNNELQHQKNELSDKRDTAKANLSKRDLIDKYNKEITELGTKGKEIAQQIADAEREEYTIKQFTKARIDECERRINGLFSFVKFKLFDYTIDGNEVETCVPLVNDIPFGVANTAGQVNAGLDIIKALQKFHGVFLPLFCDNAESVNHYPSMDNQMIFLKVTTDKELLIIN
ncbi:AAA family ATPase [Bacteroidia bacterium]|nr:AAA family ATPase [Bacteroidia bacterium]GHV71228.1 AAA family ATPase [Bacteroidia bacterium]